jgi:hypothetical protein
MQGSGLTRNVHTVLVFAVAVVLSVSLPLVALRGELLLLLVVVVLLPVCMSSLFLRCRLLTPVVLDIVLSLVLTVLLVFASVAWLAASAAALMSCSFLQHTTAIYNIAIETN